MSSNVTELLVFLASPSDLAEERASLRDLAGSINNAFAPVGIRIQVVGWEEIPPNYGRPQAQINPRVEECDIFIGMLRRRWGTDTGSHSSGFFEEFSIASHRRTADGKSPAIALYFAKLEDYEINDPGPELTRVLDFKKTVAKDHLALYSTFDSSADLEKQVSVLITTHLVEEIITKRLTETDSAATSKLTGSNIEKSVLESLLRERVKVQDLDARQIAAFVELCERLLKEDPWDAAFVEEMAEVAAEGEREATRQHMDDIPWAAAHKLLRDAAAAARERRRGGA